MSDIRDKEGSSAEFPQWKTIEELIEEIREERDGVPDHEAEDSVAAPETEIADPRTEPEDIVPDGETKHVPDPADDLTTDLDWDRIEEIANRKLAGSDLVWELTEETDPEPVETPTIADLKPEFAENPEESSEEPEEPAGDLTGTAAEAEAGETPVADALPETGESEPADTEPEEPAGDSAASADSETEDAEPKGSSEEPSEDAAEKPAKKRRGVRLFSVLVTAVLLLAFFLGIFNIAYPVDYDNLGGMHSWLSAATIKYVNNWLDESPEELHFTNYGGTYSVEYRNQEDRAAYISYPTGTTLFVYTAARLTGHEHIDISFLKHFQMIWYIVEAILLAWFVMLLAGGSGYRSETGKIAIGFMTGAIWIMMPVNLWYLSNVYFADQCVILWVMLFLPVEYLIRVKEKGGWINGEDIHALSRSENRKRLRNGHAPLLLCLLRTAIIYTGMLIDYYFWILVFMAWLTEFIGDLLNKRGLARAAGRSLWYVIPVAGGIGTFWWQISSVENWPELLLDRFLFRTTDTTAGFKEIRSYFRSAFTADSEEMMQWMIYFHLAILVLGLVYLIAHRGQGRLFRSSQCSILVTAFGAIVFHTALLKQHAGVHEFSQVKVSWWIAMMPAVAAILLLKVLAPENSKTGKSRNPNLSWLMILFLLTFSAMLYITQIPSVDRAYYQYRDQKESYPIEETVRDYTGYLDVCFSFTYEIPKTPPQQLAVSGNRIYLIETLDDINEMFPDLWMDNGRLLMVVEKAGDDELTEEQRDALDEIYNEEAVLCDNSSCTIFEIPDWTGQWS